VQELAKKYGTILIIDETHTISVGPGGMTADRGLKPDFLTIGKAIGGGIPVGAFGMTQVIADKIKSMVELEVIDTGKCRPREIHHPIIRLILRCCAIEF
jgi:glutamate-1-semialdehyde 2,1-aminomutase